MSINSTAFAMRRPLGKTGLQVSPLGIGGGGKISDEDLLYAFDKGINYFFFSSDMHHFAYRHSAEAIRQLCKHGSSVRDKVVLATVSYVNDPEKLMGILIDQFSELEIDYIDVFHWGWITDQTDFEPLLIAANQLKGSSAATSFIRLAQAAQERIQITNQELLQRGLVRYVGASFHSRQKAHQWKNSLDVLMLRYNLAHPGVELEIFPYLSTDKASNPGIVAFNTGHEGSLAFNQPLPSYPTRYPVPSIPDCYRFALSNPYVDVVLTGVENRQQVDEALAALEKGAFSPDECDALRRYGALYRRNNLMSPFGLPSVQR